MTINKTEKTTSLMRYFLSALGIAMVFSFMVSTTVNAAEIEVDGYTVEYKEVDGKIVVTGITGEFKQDEIDFTETKGLAIPAKIEDKIVESIEGFNNPGVEAVMIPEGVKTINADNISINDELSLVFLGDETTIEGDSFDGDLGNLTIFAKDPSKAKEFADSKSIQHENSHPVQFNIEVSGEVDGRLQVNLSLPTIFKERLTYVWSNSLVGITTGDSGPIGEDGNILAPEGAEGNIYLTAMGMTAANEIVETYAEFDLDKGTFSIVDINDIAKEEETDDKTTEVVKDEEKKDPKENSDEDKKDKEGEEKEEGSKEKDAEEKEDLLVPKTATNMFNFLLASVSMLLVGLTGFILFGRKRTEA